MTVSTASPAGPGTPPRTAREPSIPAGHDVGTWLVALLVFNEFSGAGQVVADLVGVSPFVPLLALATVGAVVVHARRRTAPPLPLIVAMALYVLAVVASYLSSTLDVEVVADGVSEALKELYFVVLVCLLGVRRDRWSRVALAMVVPMAVIGWLAASNEWVFEGRLPFLGFENVTAVEGEDLATARHAGPLEDANFWGRLVVVGIPFLLAWMLDVGRRRRGIALLVGAPMLVGLLLAVYLTGSRGAFIATAIGCVVFGLLAGIPRRYALGALLASPLLFVLPGVGDRLRVALGILGSSGQRAGVDSSVLERLSAQQIAMQMIADRPLLGVGPGGYMTAFPEQSALAGLTMRRVVAPHNGYLGTAAEIGLVGALAWAAVIAVGVFCAVRALNRLSLLPRPQAAALRPYVAATLAAVAAWLVSTVFLHVTYPRVLWLLVAFAALQDRDVRAMLATVPGLSRTRDPGLLFRPSDLLALAAATLLGAGIGGVVADQQGPTFEGRTVGHLVPVSAGDSYLISIRTREFVVPTFAVIVDASAPPSVSAQGNPLTGAITITAEGAAASSEAAEQLRTAANRGLGAIGYTGLGRLYTIEWEQPTTSRGPAPQVPLAFLGATLGAAAATAVLAVRRRRRATPLTGHS